MSIFDKSVVTQTGIVANKVIGRDDNSLNVIISSPIIYREDMTLKRLLEEHEAEKLSNPAYLEFSQELNKFFSKSLRVKSRNLEEKLVAGKREYLVDAAMESKEKVTKKIQKFSHYKSAQEVYTYLLTNIRTAFLHEVQSKIKSSQYATHQIDEIVSNLIIEPFLHNLQGSSLNIDKDELYGVLYFLTGNCYIEWD